MAVVQISRIQQRRGKKNSQTGLPQLASGELAWAIDSQELFIGNGSVSEGAPAVGNTKIITEHDDLIALVELYQYQRANGSIQTGPGTTTPVRRSIQQRLDDIVSIKSFGVAADGTTDDTLAIQRAINQLFLNTNKADVDSRVVLYIDPGVYKITDELRIPPYAHIVGAGIDSTIIKHDIAGSTKSVIRFVDGTSTPGHYVNYEDMDSQDTSWPKNIYLAAMTLQTMQANPIMHLDNTESTVIDRVKFLGSFENGGNYTEGHVGAFIKGISGVFTTQDITFRNCVFSKLTYGVYSNSDHQNVVIDNCKFYQLLNGIDVGGGVYGAVATKVSNSHFDLIDRYGFRIRKGYGNISLANTYINVGNNNQGYANATYPIINFVTDRNISRDDYFERGHRLKSVDNYNNVAFLPNVQTNSMVRDDTGYQLIIGNTGSGGTPASLLRFPFLGSSIIMIDYVATKGIGGSIVATISGTTMTVISKATGTVLDVGQTLRGTGLSGSMVITAGSNNTWTITNPNNITITSSAVTLSGSAMRTGTLTVTADAITKTSNINDNFSYVGDSSVEKIKFYVYLENLQEDESQNIDTVSVRYINPPYNGTGTINYSYRVMTN